MDNSMETRGVYRGWQEKFKIGVPPHAGIL